jgi:hypothetical protein
MILPRKKHSPLIRSNIVPSCQNVHKDIGANGENDPKRYLQPGSPAILTQYNS